MWIKVKYKCKRLNCTANFTLYIHIAELDLPQVVVSGRVKHVEGSSWHEVLVKVMECHGFFGSSVACF